MSGVLWHVDKLYGTSEGYAHANLTLRTTVADGPVADTAEPVAAQAGIVGADSDGDDVDPMPHG